MHKPPLVSRSVEDYVRLFRTKSLGEVAAQIQGDLIGYRITSLRRADDYDTIVRAIQAAQRITRESVVPDLLAALKLVARGIKSGHIEDQTLMLPTPASATEALMQPLSEMINAAIAKAIARIES